MSNVTTVPVGWGSRVSCVPAAAKQASDVRVSATGALNASTSPTAPHGLGGPRVAWTEPFSGRVNVHVAEVPGVAASAQTRSAVGGAVVVAVWVTVPVRPRLSVTTSVAL